MERHEILKSEYITSVEACELLAVSQRTLLRWHRLRKGPPQIKVGRKVYYRRQAISDWLMSLERDATVVSGHQS